MSSSLTDMIDGACYVRRDEDCGLTIIWNGSATFNVYRDLPGGEFDPIDCFTRYACEQGYGPRDAGMSWDEGQAWARGCVTHWLEDNVYGKPDSYFSDLSREDCVKLLGYAGIDVTDDEPIEDLREAVRVNVADGTILTEDLP